MKINHNLSRLEGKNNIKSHAELVSASSTHVVSQGQQQRQALKTLKQVQGDFINNTTRGLEGKRAFTLIELLVVVLIIGILASVALPQYQKAVAKVRLIKMIPVFKQIKEGRTLYVDETGNTHCMDISAYLDMLGISYYRYRCLGQSTDGPCTNTAGWCDGALWISPKESIAQGTGHSRYTYNKGGYNVLLTLLTFYRGYTTDEKTGDLFCVPLTNNEKNNALCKSIASSPQQVKCYYGGAKDCYRVAL